MTTVYEVRTCSKCRALDALLREHGVEAERVDLQAAPPSAAKLRELAAKAGVAPRELLRLHAPEVAELGLADPAMDEDTLLRHMAAHPGTVQRPIVETAGRAVVARPAETALELLGLA